MQDGPSSPYLICDTVSGSRTELASSAKEERLQSPTSSAGQAVQDAREAQGCTGSGTVLPLTAQLIGSSGSHPEGVAASTLNASAMETSTSCAEPAAMAASTMSQPLRPARRKPVADLEGSQQVASLLDIIEKQSQEIASLKQIDRAPVRPLVTIPVVVPVEMPAIRTVPPMSCTSATSRPVMAASNVTTSPAMCNETQKNSSAEFRSAMLHSSNDASLPLSTLNMSAATTKHKAPEEANGVIVVTNEEAQPDYESQLQPQLELVDSCVALDQVKQQMEGAEDEEGAEGGSRKRPRLADGDPHFDVGGDAESPGLPSVLSGEPGDAMNEDSDDDKAESSGKCHSQESYSSGLDALSAAVNINAGSAPSPSSGNLPQLPQLSSSDSSAFSKPSGMEKSPLSDEHPPFGASLGSIRQCIACGTTQTPKWRCGMTLCNACGLRWAKRAMRKGEVDEEEQLIEVSGSTAAGPRKLVIPGPSPRMRLKGTSTNTGKSSVKGPLLVGNVAVQRAMKRALRQPKQQQQQQQQLTGQNGVMSGAMPGQWGMVPYHFTTDMATAVSRQQAMQQQAMSQTMRCALAARGGMTTFSRQPQRLGLGMGATVGTGSDQAGGKNTMLAAGNLFYHPAAMGGAAMSMGATGPHSGMVSSMMDPSTAMTMAGGMVSSNGDTMPSTPGTMMSGAMMPGAIGPMGVICTAMGAMGPGGAMMPTPQQMQMLQQAQMQSSCGGFHIMHSPVANMGTLTASHNMHPNSMQMPQS